MAISQASLAWLYVYAIVLGVILGAIYDLLRISRVFFGAHYSRRGIKRLQGVRLPLLKERVKKKKKRALGVIVFFEDLFFCVFCGIALERSMYSARLNKFS